MDIMQLIQMITNNGFAIVVAAYCLITLNKSINSMNETLTELKTILSENEKGGNSNEK